MLMIIAIASSVTAIAGYFYFRPPQLKPLSEEGLRNAIRIGMKQQSIHD